MKIQQTYVLLLLIVALVNKVQCSLKCIQYLLQLKNMSITDPVAFLHSMTPYLVLSGKSIDDLGFPGSCQQDQNKYKYFTVQVNIQANTTMHAEYTGYLGFCFTRECTVDNLNNFAEFIIDFIFEEYEDDEVSGKFIQPPLSLQFSPSALVLCLMFTIIIFIQMLQPILRWISLCKQPATLDTQYQIKSVYIDLQNPHLQLQQDRLTTQSSWLQRISLRYKWKQLWKQETSYHIFSFSLYRVLAVPLILYGQIFWFTNYGAYNYYAFYQQIYEQFYVKIAMFAYYIPDGFFFISAFLYTRKIMQLPNGEYSGLFKAFAWKICRLYPLYIVALVIYWGISPALHQGPIWYVYQEQAKVCNYAWWRVILMIDNWFAQGCYPALWFVQVQAQFALFVTIMLFIAYKYNRKIGRILLGLYAVAAFVILFVFDPRMLVSVSVAIDPYTQLYFKSFYSHIWFYLMGVFFAVLSQKQSIRISLQNILLDKKIPYSILKLISGFILVLILLRPWIWSGDVSLSLQLTFCRIGFLMCMIIFFLNGMFVKQSTTTVIHKYAYYMYPVILVSYMITASSFWSAGSFMYVSGKDVMNQMVPNFLICYCVGIFLGILFDWRNLVSSS